MQLYVCNITSHILVIVSCLTVSKHVEVSSRRVCACSGVASYNQRCIDIGCTLMSTATIDATDGHWTALVASYLKHDDGSTNCMYSQISLVLFVFNFLCEMRHFIRACVKFLFTSALA